MSPKVRSYPRAIQRTPTAPVVPMRLPGELSDLLDYYTDQAYSDAAEGRLQTSEHTDLARRALEIAIIEYGMAPRPRTCDHAWAHDGQTGHVCRWCGVKR